MRTTVEVTAEQHEALVAIARRRGLRGFSQVVQEALDAYLSDLSAAEVDLLLSLEGSIDEEEEDRMRNSIEKARASWRAS